MAVTQYIGARYVPLFSDPIEWSSANSYEPLTIVTHQGNSYTSKQYVPIGIDIDNEEFWAVTGNYNAQVEAYREEVIQYEREVGNYNAQVEAYREEVIQYEREVQGFQTQIDDEVDAREAADAAEQTARETADAAEQTARIAADNALQNQIDNIDTKIFKTRTITVEDYGAIGDGVTDSTLAIQKAIAENPNCIINFRGGYYIVSDTIHCWGNRGGQEINLGGSFIVWQGSNLTSEMFSIDRTDRLTEGDYLYPYSLSENPQESECKIVNGTLKAGGCGIYARAFHTIIDNVKILDATQAAIKIGDETSHISMQAKITDVHIMRSTNFSEYWSEQASAINQSLNETACGIEIYDTDCNFSDINVNRYPVSIRIHAGGQTFENCHFTAEYKARRAALANTAAVVFDLWNPNTIYTDIFDTCYFDNHKYCIWSNVAIRHVVSVCDGMYFNSGNQVSTSTTQFEAYMSKNANEIKVDNFNVVPADGRCNFIPAKMLIAGSNFQGLSLTQEHYVQNIYNGTENGHRFWTANQNFDDGEYVNIVRTSNSLQSGVDQCIGCLAMPGDNMTRFNDVHVIISDRAYLFYEGYIHYSGTSLVMIDVATRGVSRGRYNFNVGQSREISFDGNTVTVWPLYIHPNQDFSNTPIYMALDTNNSNVIGFLNAGGFRDFNYAHGTWVIEKSFS